MRTGFDLTLLSNATAQPQPKRERRVEPVAKAPSSDEIYECPDAKPFLHVITTPAEMRAHWESWQQRRSALFISVVILATLIALTLFLD